MASGASSLRARLTRLSKTWPVDPLRPHLYFGAAIDRNLTSKVKFEALPPPALKFAEEAVDCLEAIRVGRESLDHPPPASILRPKSDPDYYNRIRRTLERAARGEDTRFTFAQRVRIFFGRKP